MKIVHVASELYPYVKTGGLADAVGALVTTLAERGHEVAAIVPGYRALLDRPEAAGATRVLRLHIPMGDLTYTGEVRAFSPRPRLTVYMICRDECFDRRGLYGNGERDYEDNALRFLFFQKGAIEALSLLDGAADIVHCHDWQAALLPLLLRDTERRTRATLATATVFTIHNILFQGLFPMRYFDATNLPPEYRGIDGLEFYGQMNLLKGGLLYADKITTVSPHYAEEILTPAFGCGLEGVIATRRGDLQGLINGIDPTVWNPSIDPLLPARYNSEDLAGKAACRDALLKLTGLEASAKTPIYGMVCRLTEQKGINLLLANKNFFLKEKARLVVLGSGEKRYEDAVKALCESAPGKMAFAHRLDEGMSHLIEAGSDFFLMPSLFEPCGLNQMYSQVYGTLPLASDVGGLSDTVIDLDEEPRAGTGLTFEPTAEGLRHALKRSLRLFADPARYAAAQRRGMTKDFGWATAATAYEKLYQGAV